MAAVKESSALVLAASRRAGLLEGMQAAWQADGTEGGRQAGALPSIHSHPRSGARLSRGCLSRWCRPL